MLNNIKSVTLYGIKVNPTVHSMVAPCQRNAHVFQTPHPHFVTLDLRYKSEASVPS